jgi:GTP-binding protein Era
LKKCGFIAVIGDTNAGKSTLINRLTGQKVSIVSRKVQTTSSRILGIAIFEESQVIFIDTPGFSEKKNGGSLERIAQDAFRESENILFVVDSKRKNFDANIALLNKIGGGKKISLALNKIDLIHKPRLLEIARTFSEAVHFENIFMVSGLTGDGVDEMANRLARSVPEGDWIYEEDVFTDMPFEKYVAEITREHIYHRVHQEVPYRCVTETESCQNLPDGSVKIVQNIRVQTRAHKIILVGHGGEKIKAVGKASGAELSSLLDRKVHLFLHVLIDENAAKNKSSD